MSEPVYYKRSLAVDVYPHLKMAIGLIDSSLPKVAVDVGCGAGRDAFYLAENGFKVHAYDKSGAAIARLKEECPLHLNEMLFPQVCNFDRFEYPRSSLVSACSSLFFCPPEFFSAAWLKITESILHGGVFCGHFMGPNDSWAKMAREDLTVHTRAELEELFEHTFKIVDVYENNSEGMTLVGKKKHWHTYSVVAQKII
ncbi:MAG: class I SAM-dependent methyltransferase [Thalassolituus oleivorans]|uniref:class I SAM-dependent methyltransferase n=1 Tax=Thalassolituus oleivorans TaxID=187493 RepID=UPI001B710D3D|nr:class I SAM-dependent methyltransferase [Thalassolituus oleivorans]MBQ0727284.1 class I SAM-dependent methyltransferase [Thalassolituus oleivorans]